MGNVSVRHDCQRVNRSMSSARLYQQGSLCPWTCIHAFEPMSLSEGDVVISSNLQSSPIHHARTPGAGRAAHLVHRSLVLVTSCREMHGRHERPSASAWTVSCCVTCTTRPAATPGVFSRPYLRHSASRFKPVAASTAF